MSYKTIIVIAYIKNIHSRGKIKTIKFILCFKCCLYYTNYIFELNFAYKIVKIKMNTEKNATNNKCKNKYKWKIGAIIKYIEHF